MPSKNKYVSCLDLKLLGARFITVPDSHLEISTTFSNIRKSKNYELPSIPATVHEKKIRQGSIPQEEEDEKAGAYGQKKQQATCLPALQKCGGRAAFSEKQRQEIEKYRGYISKLKQDNQIIHREIQNLFKEERLTANQPKTKNVRNIVQAGRDILPREGRFRLGPQADKYQRVYQSLGSQLNLYRNDSLEIQKKFSSNNIYKGFENFLESHHKRVPDFIKNIR